jgi:hypothetical protein
MGHLFVVPAALVNADDHQNVFFKRASYPVVSLTAVLGGMGDEMEIVEEMRSR